MTSPKARDTGKVVPKRKKASRGAGDNHHVFSDLDYFSEMIPAWQRFLVPALYEVNHGRRHRRPTVLILGCHEARSAIWLLEHAFKADGRDWPVMDVSASASDQLQVPHVTVVEPFYPSFGVVRPRSERVRFAVNLRGHVIAKRARVIVDRSYVDVLRQLQRESSASSAQFYDAITIDATGNSRQVLEAMVVAWPLLRPGGGVMVVSNYTYSSERDSRCPRRGIDAFLEAYSDDLRVLATQWHVFIARLPSPRKLSHCSSEYFPV